jgi:hippurate hydrolase
LIPAIAGAFGARATLRYERVYPATVNHDRQAEFAAEVADALVGKDNVVRNLDPSMGSEDFAFMLQAKPGAFARLGQGGAEGGCFLHNSKYDFNDEVIPLGAGYLAALAERAMPLAER